MKLTRKQQTRLRQQLLKRKSELEKMLARDHDHGLDRSSLASIGELSMYDNHPADIGTELYERSKDFVLTENAEHNLEEVIIALENLQSGTYGNCSACGKPIPYLRLEAIPWTSYCIRHVPESEAANRRPIEEQFLNPPFGRTSLDEQGSDSRFDGEDAWQIVESYGNSNSPAMAEDPESFDYDNAYLEAEENDGYVEPIESFLATDLYGNARLIVRNNEYHKYMEGDEGDHELEVIPYSKR